MFPSAASPRRGEPREHLVSGRLEDVPRLFERIMTTTKHILRMSCGVTVEMTFDEETAQMDCEWTPPPPYSLKTMKKIREEYEPWRNGIVKSWAQRNNKNVMLLSL
jgi:hypothetical protein